MKKLLCIVLVLLLSCVCFAGCGEGGSSSTPESSTPETSSDTSSAGSATDTSSTTVSDTASTETSSNKTESTVSTPENSTPDVKDPSGIDTGKTYKGECRKSGDMLVRPIIEFDGEYCVLTSYCYVLEPNDYGEQIVYEGTTYYGEGGGFNPCFYEFTSIEMILKSAYEEGIVIARAVLLNDGNIKITASTDADFPVNTVLKPQ